MFLSRGDRDLGVAFQTYPGRQAFISSGSKEPRSALESRRVSLGAHWVDSRESSLLRRLERGRHTESFCQDRALYLGIMQAIEIVDGKDTKSGIAKGAIPDILQKALAVNFDRSIGHDYLKSPIERYDYYHNTEILIPFDLDMLNRITEGGLAPKTLTVLTAAPNAGKTLMMCHMTAANMMSGKNVLYFTMEMAEKRIAQRIDANLLNIPISKLIELDKTNFVSRINKLRDRTPGDLVIKEFPTGAGNVSHFKHTLTELSQKKGFKPDIVYVDYMNICSSSRYHRMDGVNSYTVVKSIAEELRGLAVEYDVPVVTATQLNREGADSSDPSMTDTSDSFGTPMTADLQLAIITSPDLDKEGRIEIKQLKNRDHDVSNYRKFKLKIDRDRMRLMDDDNQSFDSNVSSSRNSSSERLTVPKNVFNTLNFDE